jgi:hypothetical protein
MESDEESLGDRKEKLTEQAELESLKRFKHVQPRIGMWRRLYLPLRSHWSSQGSNDD